MAKFQNAVESILGSTAGFMLNISIRNLSRQRRNTLLTILTIFVAMTTFVLSVSVVASASIAVTEFTVGHEGQGMVVHDYENFFDRDSFDSISSNTEVNQAIPRIKLIRRLNINEFKIFNSTGTSRSIMLPFASNWALEDSLSNLSSVLISGQLPVSNYDICITNEIANLLDLELGEKVKIETLTVQDPAQYNISGIIDPSVLHTYTDFTGNWYVPEDVETGLHQPVSAEGMAFMSHDSLWRLLPSVSQALIKDGSYNEIAIDFKEGIDTLSLVEKILPVQVDQAREVLVSSGQTRQLYKISTSISVRGFTFMIFVLLIAGLIILNTLLGAISARMKDIEVWSSVGANPSHIKYNFMFESMIFGLVGGTLGYLAAIALSFFGNMIGFPTSITPDKYDFNWLFITVLVAVLLSLLSAIYPSRKASTVVVPSLKRSWKPGLREQLTQQYSFDEEEIPITLEPRDFNEYADYIQTRMEIPTFFKVKRKWPVKVEELKDGNIKHSFKLDVAVFSAEGTYALISMWSIEEPGVPTMKVYAQVNPYSSFGESSGWAQSSTNFNKASFDVLNMLRQLSLKWRVEGRKLVIQRD
ncbi:MAG: ABC transporter permease [Candidatus Hodarchaeales archaeon]